MPEMNSRRRIPLPRLGTTPIFDANSCRQNRRVVAARSPPYGSPITADRASAVIQAAVAESKKRDWQMNIAVVERRRAAL
jgi:hypothetical protein